MSENHPPAWRGMASPMDDQERARFRHALRTLAQPRDAEGVDCLPPMPPAVATATPDGNDVAFIQFLVQHPDAVLYLTCPKNDTRVLRVFAEANGLRVGMAVSLIGLDLKVGRFPTIAEVLRSIERELFKDKPDA